MNNKVVIVTDSTCDLSPELINKYGIVVVPLLVTFNDEVYQDGVTLTTSKLYELVEEKKMLPKTASPSPSVFIEAFRPIIEAGKDIVYLGIGSGFSGTLQNAYLAKTEFEEGRIELVDSCNLSTGIGLLVLKAAKFASQGDDAKTIKRKLEEIVPKVHSQFVIDTFEYLHKGGRCSGMQALIGTMFKIKPLIRVVNNKMVVAEKPRGKKMGLDAMIRDILSYVGRLDKDAVMITHSFASEDEVEYIKEKLSTSIDVDNIYLTSAGCVISSHCGKGTIGILYIEE
jgi:DegV family protein with EDD domain